MCLEREKIININKNKQKRNSDIFRIVVNVEFRVQNRVSTEPSLLKRVSPKLASS